MIIEIEHVELLNIDPMNFKQILMVDFNIVYSNNNHKMVYTGFDVLKKDDYILITSAVTPKTLLAFLIENELIKKIGNEKYMLTNKLFLKYLL